MLGIIDIHECICIYRTEENNFVLDQAIGLRHVNDAKGQ